MEYTIRFLIYFMIVCLIYYLYNSIYLLEPFDQLSQTQSEPNIQFLSPTQAVEFISGDPDGYVGRFNKLDYQARDLVLPSDYTNLFESTVVQPSHQQIQQIKSSVSKALKLIEHIYPEDKVWVDIDLFRSIPWKFIITNSKQIDQGLPHTRYDTIILNQSHINSSDNFVDTLIHEQLHVYQKLHPEKFDLYLQTNNFVPLVKYKESGTNYRSNPDTDDWIYIHLPTNQIYCSKYKSSNPKSIFDVKYEPFNSFVYEHPREKAVYNLVEKLFKK